MVTSAIDDRTPSDHLIYTYQIDLESDGVFDKKGEGRDASGNYPLGRHSIEWTVEDESGNIALSKYEFTIRDCQAPKAYCVNGKSVELASREAGLRVWANDLDLSSMDNCGITELRIASPSAGPGQSIPPPANDYVVFGCQSVGVQSVDVWVKDEGDNWDYCTTYLHVSDRKQLCPTEKAVETTAPTQVSGEVEGTNPRLGFGHNAAASSSLEGFQLFQNYPNPFEEQTTIRFHLPEAASATLTIYDLTGKVVKTIGGNYTSGFHNVELKKSDLAGQQVLYYQLDTDLYSASMKMLLVD
ncbi:MAG: T9SS type A sorting domain-containing protein [Bacteroidota bacterium]